MESASLPYPNASPERRGVADIYEEIADMLSDFEMGGRGAEHLASSSTQTSIASHLLSYARSTASSFCTARTSVASYVTARSDISSSTTFVEKFDKSVASITYDGHYHELHNPKYVQPSLVADAVDDAVADAAANAAQRRASNCTALNSPGRAWDDSARLSDERKTGIWVAKGTCRNLAASFWSLIESIEKRLLQRTEKPLLFDRSQQAILTLEQDIFWTLVTLIGVGSNVTSLEPAIRGVTRCIDTFERRHSSGIDMDAEVLKLDVAVEIYMYALDTRRLRYLVPNGMFSDGQMSTSEWLLHLHSRDILPTEAHALDWSGRGQHAEYSPDEEPLIPLIGDKVLGSSMSAVVQSVRCRRIQLARKTIRCNKRLTKEMAVTEVAHLQLVQHQHIVRLVGTYTFKKNLAILLYPAAEWNLDEFLGEFIHTHIGRCDRDRLTIRTFFGCLANAMAFIHAQNIKHMDIKPGNVLVREKNREFRVYIADFGIARAYKSAEDSNTDSPTSFTRTYAAPEVVAQDLRGYSADIFSLGCVFLEIVEALLSVFSLCPQQSLSTLRTGDRSYSANLGAVLGWCDQVLGVLNNPSLWSTSLSSATLATDGNNWMPSFKGSLDLIPERRPSACDLRDKLCYVSCGCCDEGPEAFEAASP
jgi:serine/threonine protein kinase